MASKIKTQGPPLWEMTDKTNCTRDGGTLCPIYEGDIEGEYEPEAP